MISLEWLIEHAAAVFWYQMRRELTTPRPPQRRPRYPRRP